MALCTSVLFVLTALVAFAAGKPPAHGRRVVCYMASWGPVLAGDGRFTPADAEKALPFCTHLVYLFANLDGNTHTIIPLDRLRDFDNGGYNQTVSLKKKYPHIRVMVGLGGWVDGSEKYSNMAKDPAKRQTFLKSVIEFLTTHQLDGLDLNWQFPGERGGIPADKPNLVALTKEMKKAFDRRGWILSVAVSAFPPRMNAGIDVKGLSQNIHFFNVLSYEYHQTWDGRVGPSAPLYAPDNFSVSDTILTYLSQGAPAYQLNMGLSAYGTDFNLANAFSNGTLVGQRVTGHGFRGTFNDVNGFLAYNELCLDFEGGNWEKTRDEVSQTPFARNFDRVVSYDDAASYDAKIKYAMEKQLGGIIFYGLEKDDFKGLCVSSKRTPYPLMESIHASLMQHSNIDYPRMNLLLRSHPAKYFWNGYKD